MNEEEEVHKTSCDHYIQFVGCNFTDGCVFKNIPQITCEIKEEEERNRFPIKTSVYLHSSKECMYDKGEELGLSKEAISDNFSYCCYEVKVNIEVNEDGTYKILSVEE